ncbi:MAG TPA: glutamine amidotransferase [Verrucomicrobiae bacterium]|nr:glutamine amidotransferase [Verrucomicrobiae bacterium]
MRLKICHLYPDLMDLYGDRGNILTLAKRCSWRGIEVEVVQISLQQSIDFRDTDIVFIGGGSDREQGIMYEDLCRRRDNLLEGIDDGLVVLGICGGLQLLGKYYQTAEGDKIPGIDILDLWTVAGNKRLIGNVCIETEDMPKSTGVGRESNLSTLVGFENHSGQTFLGNARPLGRVVKGNGNNGQDGYEGVRHKNVFGTYLHGPLLPKNPHFADLLLSKALERRYSLNQLSALDDTFELAAHNYMVSRLKQR